MTESLRNLILTVKLGAEDKNKTWQVDVGFDMLIGRTGSLILNGYLIEFV